jgi:mono/diheme cytochrome c family protein
MLMAAGCGTDDPDIERGRQLFIQKCASCHAMAESGSTSNVGPDLDQAFYAARDVGMDSDTVEGVVARQIENPRPQVEGQPAVSMPADLVEGKDLVDVAAYVAEYAGVEGIEAPEFALPEYFVNSCGGCHVLDAAGTMGQTGPNLDEALPGQSADQVEESIVNPGAQISPGYGNLMPNTFGAALTPDQLEQLVGYLVESTGGPTAQGGTNGGPPGPQAESNGAGGSGASTGSQGN